MEQIRIDLIPGGVTPNAHASQYDIGRVIRFKLYNGESPYTLAGTETVTIDITKPDGVEETITLTNTSSDYVDFITEDGLLNQAGLYECEFRITNGGDDIGTQNFNLRAEADAKGAIIIMEAQGNPAHFETDLAGALVSCIVDISYNASGYKSALVLNTSNTPTTNKTPYLFRPSFANGYGYETLIGGTCGVNQLVQNGNFTNDNVWSWGAVYSHSVSNNIATITFKTQQYNHYINQNVNVVANHYYLVTATVQSSDKPNGLRFNFQTISSTVQGFGFSGNISTKTIVSVICKPTEDCTNLMFRFADGDSGGTATIENAMLIDLTQMFGTTIADYVYTLESGTSGAGITWLKNNGFFGADYYPYNAGGLLSVKTSKKINRDSNNVIVGEYPLDDIELRGILKLDGNNNLVYDGDTYNSSGEVVRKYEYRAYASGDESLPDTITDGINTVTKLVTPTFDTADPFTNPMIVDGNGTEEFVDTRAVQMPVGHSTIYGEDMKARFTDFGVTVYGGEYNLTTGVLTSTKNADGTDKNPPDVYQLAPVYIPVRNGGNYIANNTNGDAHVKFIKKA